MVGSPNPNNANNASNVNSDGNANNNDNVNNDNGVRPRLVSEKMLERLGQAQALLRGFSSKASEERREPNS